MTSSPAPAQLGEVGWPVLSAGFFRDARGRTNKMLGINVGLLKDIDIVHTPLSVSNEFNLETITLQKLYVIYDIFSLRTS